MRRLQLTLAILKPDLFARPQPAEVVRSMILNKGLYIVRSKTIHWTQDVAETFYAEQKGKSFFGRLLSYMCSGKMNPMILAGFNSIEVWRNLMGPFSAKRRAPDTIRGKYAQGDTRNSVHGADSDESVTKEIKLIFPEFDIQEWMNNEEQCFRYGNVEYFSELGIHKCKNAH